MSTYYVSTPTFTAVVEVNLAGLISHTAPSLRRTWKGKPFVLLLASLRRRWGTTLRVQELP